MTTVPAKCTKCTPMLRHLFQNKSDIKKCRLSRNGIFYKTNLKLFTTNYTCFSNHVAKISTSRLFSNLI